MKIVSKNTVLYVDDEESNLVAFNAIFRRKYNVLTATSPARGLEILRNTQNVKVIISDQRMKGATGVNFFETVKIEFPNTIRIILTGFSDEEAIRDAINKAGVYRFLSKPWDENDLTKTIESGIELYDARVDIESKNAELEKAYGELNKFVYSASHDMRAPLVSIMSLLELYKEDKSIEHDKTYIPLIEKSVLMLDEFVKNIVAYYQNEEKEKSIDVINIEDLISESLVSLGHFQDISDIKIHKQINYDNSVVNDVFRVRVILNNIISNSVKYQKNDALSKWITIEASNVTNGLKVSITDNGIGIDQEDIDSLFDMFYRATSHNSGSGIGLHIVKEAINKIDGKISVNSLKGEGTTFDVFIPHLNR